MKRLALCAFILLFYAVIASATFGIAGTFDLPFVWLVFALQIVVGLVSVFVLDPDLISERIKPRGKDEDKHAKWRLTILLVLNLVLTALDLGRFHLSDKIPPSMQVVGLLLSALGWAGFLWTMVVNRFFSSAIRLQIDRGQIVIDSGPYKFVRHPGYATAVLALLGQSIALGSWLGVVPILIFVFVLVKRTLFEETFLLENLPGYKEYFQSVRWRWCPGIW
jgi:protein-S-isoprenylcysteine O-methyltransferase Ste14